MPYEPLRVALIGCGDAGAAHALTVQRHPDTVLVGCHDKAATPLADHYQVADSPTIEDLLETKPDLVIIATGPLAQPDVVGVLLEHGYTGAMLCEKPIATNLSAAREIVDRANDAGVVLAVNHQRRFGLVMRRSQDLIAAGAIGELVRIEGHAADGTLFDWAPHWVDLAFLLTGDAPVTWVQGTMDLSTRRHHAGLDLEGSSHVVWEHENGVRGQLDCGMPCAGQPLLRLLGTEGMIEIGAVEPRDGKYVRGRPLRVLATQAAGWQAIDVGEGALGAAQWIRALDELIGSIRANRKPANDGCRAIAALEVCLAGYLSAATGVRQRLPMTSSVDVRTTLAGFAMKR